MLTKLPRHTPPLAVMLADIGNPHPQEIARHLGVGYSTVRRWIAADEAPRCAALALFQVTRWGQQWTHTDLYNALQTHCTLANTLRDQLVLMRERYEPESTEAVPPVPAARPLLYAVGLA